MNRASWSKVYSAHQQKSAKPSAASARPSSSTLGTGTRGRTTSYASAARALHQPSKTANTGLPSQSRWAAPLSTDLASAPSTLTDETKPNEGTIILPNTSDLFCSILVDKTNDPQALAVQEYLHQFVSRSVQRSHGDKLDTVCARVDDLAISTAARMQASDDLLQESNARISNLMTTQTDHANSLSTLERILLQQTATLNNQVELLRTWKATESTTTTTTTLSTSSSMLPAPQLSDDMDIVNTSPQST